MVLGKKNPHRMIEKEEIVQMLVTARPAILVKMIL
jgi:hypothetical protein